MSAVKAVQYLLRQSAPLASIVGTRIHTGKIPQGSATPTLLIEEVDGVPEVYISAFDQPREWSTRVQITAVGTYSQVKAALRAVEDALAYAAGVFDGVEVRHILPALVGPDQYDSTTDLHEQPIDFIVTHYR